MNLMIVEDELRLRERIAGNIDWAANGIEIVGLASNGKEALLMMEHVKPDIVLADIRMPEMDGLQLAHTIKEYDPDTKVVFLSGYDDFHFAQRGIELGVTKYLLKPARNEDILQAVLEAKEQLGAELEARHNLEALQLKWTEHLPRLQDMFYHDWVMGRYSLWELQARSRGLMIPLAEDRRYLVIVAEIDPIREAEERFTGRDMSLLHFSVHRIALESFGQAECRIAQDSEQRTVLLLNSPADESDKELLNRANGYCAKLLRLVKECLKLTASAGIGGGAVRMEHVHASYQEARKALQERAVYGHDIAVPFHREFRQRSAVPLLADKEEKLLEIALETGEEAKALGALSVMIEKGIDAAETVTEVRESLFYISSILVRAVRAQGWAIAELDEEGSFYFDRINGLLTKDQIIEWLRQTVKHIVSHVNERRRSGSHRMIDAILSLIENDLDKDISLYYVADKLYLNSSYVSRVFKQEMGESFTHYVLKRKMERAKELLHEGCKVYDVASTVGYKNVSYFSKIFGKYWGMTPGEVRRLFGV